MSSLTQSDFEENLEQFDMDRVILENEEYGNYIEEYDKKTIEIKKIINMLESLRDMMKLLK